MRIPKTPVQTSWRADWLVEFSIALIALAFVAREIIFAVVGAGILLALASLGLLFHRELEILRRELDVVEHLPKARTFLGDSIEGDLTIRNGSRLAARILTVRPVVEQGLSVKLSSSFNQLLRPDTASSSRFEITSLKSGRFRISGFTLAFTDSRGLFAGEVNYEQSDWVEVYPGVRTKAPITPLRLYGGSPEVFRKGPAGMDYAGIRQYAPGDEYHRVEWKATARLQTLMVKEFHPETQTTLQILIDSGRSMHQQSHVGTRIDEAFSVALLLTETAAGSARQVGIWVYNETEIVKSAKLVVAREQLANIRELSLACQEENLSKYSASGAEDTRNSQLRTIDLVGAGPLGGFMRLLRVKLTSGYRDTGIYKALREATERDPDGFLIVLTDLQTNSDALLAAATGPRGGKRVIVAQIAAAWRLSLSLEEAYSEYHINARKVRRLQQSGLTLFDSQPESLIEAIAFRVFQQSSK